MVIAGVLFMCGGHSNTRTWLKQKPRPLNFVRRELLLKKVCVKAPLSKRLVGGLMHLEVSDIAWS